MDPPAEDEQAPPSLQGGNGLASNVNRPDCDAEELNVVLSELNLAFLGSMDVLVTPHVHLNDPAHASREDLEFGIGKLPSNLVAMFRPRWTTKITAAPRFSIFYRLSQEDPDLL